jgi:ribose 5-phosphate isomerase B
MSNRIGIASDHGGKYLKEKVSAYLRSQGWDLVDFGVAVTCQESVDYPDYAAELARAVSQGQLTRGILICGTGIGMSIAANKFPAVRAALVWDEFTARMSRQHNDANILCLGERVLNHDRALEFLQIWLTTEFEGSRHQRRLDKIRQLEQR